MLIRTLRALLLLLIMNEIMLMGVGLNNRQERALSIFNNLMPGYPRLLLEPALSYYNIKKTYLKKTYFYRLHHAAVDGNLDAAKKLLEQGANVNLQSNDRRAALHYAAESGHDDIVKLLLDKGADVNLKTNDRTTPLHIVAYKGNIELSKLLIKAGADLNATNYYGWTPLHIAANNGCFAIAKALLGNNVNVNLQDSNGRTPLHLSIIGAVKREFASFLMMGMIALLLSRGAKADITDNDGQTPQNVVDQALEFLCPKENSCTKSTLESAKRIVNKLENSQYTERVQVIAAMLKDVIFANSFLVIFRKMMKKS